LADRLGRRPAKPMGSPCVGSNPTAVVLCHCRFVCLQGLHVCLDPDAEHCFLCPGKINAAPPAACFPDSRRPSPETRRGCQRDMAQRARADGLSPQPANCKCAGHILSSELLTDLPSRTLGIQSAKPSTLCGRGLQYHGGCFADLGCISLFALHAPWHVAES
jgi:hypothetical protein